MKRQENVSEHPKKGSEVRDQESVADKNFQSREDPYLPPKDYRESRIIKFKKYRISLEEQGDYSVQNILQGLLYLLRSNKTM